jgi:hypothetical protein
MTSSISGQQAVYLIIAIGVVGAAFVAIAWAGKTMRGELSATGARQAPPPHLSTTEQIPSAIMKEAIARGMVQPAQLAAMTPEERAFVFASLKEKLAAGGVGSPVAAPGGAPGAAPVAAPVAAPATVRVSARATPVIPATFDDGKLRVWCAMCGTELQLPAVPPLRAQCANCGMKSAIYTEERGRYTLTIAPGNGRGERGV